MTTDYEKNFLPFFDELADTSRAIALNYFRTNLAVDDKEDRTPVTQADKEIEEKLREMIHKKFPSHGIIGEEFGAENTNAEFVWVLDPIDGTKAFVCGIPLFGTIIGLTHNGVPKVGLVEQAYTKERWLGIADQFCRLNNKSVHVAPPRILEAARCYAFVPDKTDPNLQKGHEALRDKAKITRYYGDCYGYALLASGFIDLVIEQQLNVYDVIGLIPLIQGAGGWASDWQLQPADLSFKGGFIAASTKALAEEALALF